MKLALLPANLKFLSKIVTKNIPMGFELNKREEYVLSGVGIAPPFICKRTYVWDDYTVVTIQTDAEGRPQRFGLTPLGVQKLADLDIVVQKKETVKEVSPPVTYTQENFVELAKFVTKVLLGMDYTRLPAIISKPDQWLVYAEDEKILTRLIFTHKVEDLKEVSLLGRQVLLVCRRVNRVVLSREVFTRLYTLQMSLRAEYDALITSQDSLISLLEGEEKTTGISTVAEEEASQPEESEEKKIKIGTLE